MPENSKHAITRLLVAFTCLNYGLMLALLMLREYNMIVCHTLLYHVDVALLLRNYINMINIISTSCVFITM